MSAPEGSAWCIEAPKGRHLPDPDTSEVFNGFCRYCSAEIELREDAQWHLPGPRMTLENGKIARVIGGAVPLRRSHDKRRKT